MESLNIERRTRGRKGLPEEALQLGTIRKELESCEHVS